MKIIEIKEVSFPDSVIGAGTFGSVELICGEVAYSNKTSKHILIAKKTFKGIVDYEREKSLNLYIRNASIKQKIDCLCAAFYCNDPQLQLYMEYITGSTLDNYVDEFRKAHDKLSINLLHHLLTDAIAAVNQLHAINIIHYDLKANNLIVKENMKIVIIDFSLSARKGDKINAYETKASYQPPEVAKEHVAHESIDAFSLGVCFLNILRNTNSALFDNNHRIDYQKVDVEVESGLKCWTTNDSTLFKTIKLFLIKCISISPNERPSLKDSFIPVFDGSQSLQPHSNNFLNKIKCKLAFKISTMDQKFREIAKKYENMKKNFQLKSKECEQHTTENRQLKLQLESQKQKNSDLETQLEVESVRNFLKDDEIATLSYQYDSQIQQLHSIKVGYDAVTQQKCKILEEMEILKTLHTDSNVQNSNQDNDKMDVDSGDSEEIFDPMHICDYNMTVNSESQNQKVHEEQDEQNEQDENLQGTINEGTTSNSEIKTHPQIVWGTNRFGNAAVIDGNCKYSYIVSYCNNSKHTYTCRGSHNKIKCGKSITLISQPDGSYIREEKKLEQ